MNAGAETQGWSMLLRREWLAPLAVLLGGILLHSMNVLMLATVLPTVVSELGGASLMRRPQHRDLRRAQHLLRRRRRVRRRRDPDRARAGDGMGDCRPLRAGLRRR